MKKIISILLIILSLAFFGCEKEENYNRIKVILPSGTPLVAVGGLLLDENYEFEVVGGADLLTAALAKDEYDVVIAPITAATKLHLLGKSAYKFASVITTGNNYLVSKNGSTALSDVAGRKILAYGQNNTPDIVLKAVLEANDLEATIEYQVAVSDIVPFIVQNTGDYDYYLTAEPTLTQLKLKYGQELTVIDLQESLKEEIDVIPQAGIFVLEKEDNKKEIARFLELVEKNIEYLNEIAKNIIKK